MVNFRFSINSHTNLDDRIKAAQQLQKTLNYPIDITVDLMDNKAGLWYGGQPQRIVVIQDNTVKFVGSNDPFLFSVKDLVVALQKLI